MMMVFPSSYLEAIKNYFNMTTYIETKICEINDVDFQSLISELCECLNFDKFDFKNRTMANLFSAVVTEGKKMDLRNLIASTILAKKVKTLELGSVLYCVCCELINRSGKAMDDMMGKTIFTVVKQCYKAINPPMIKAQRPTRLQIAHQFKTELIMRRRRNGSFL